ASVTRRSGGGQSHRGTPNKWCSTGPAARNIPIRVYGNSSYRAKALQVHEPRFARVPFQAALSLQGQAFAGSLCGNSDGPVMWRDQRASEGPVTQEASRNRSDGFSMVTIV